MGFHGVQVLTVLFNALGVWWGSGLYNVPAHLGFGGVQAFMSFYNLLGV
jgi:hypothetical protein